MDGLPQGPAQEPVVLRAVGLGEQTAGVTRAPPLSLGRGRGGGARTGEEREEVQHLVAVHGLGATMQLVHPKDVLESTGALLLLLVVQPGLTVKKRMLS